MTLGFSTDEIRSLGVENVDMKVSSSLLDIPIVSTEKHSTSCFILLSSIPELVTQSSVNIAMPSISTMYPSLWRLGPVSSRASYQPNIPWLPLGTSPQTS